MRTQQYFDLNKAQYIKVSLSKEERDSILKDCESMNSKIEEEYVYSKDGIGISARWFVGLLGEYAVAKQFKEMGLIESLPSRKFTKGLSIDYDTADFLKFDFILGCKTSSMGRVAKIKEQKSYAEVICVYDKPSHDIYICGIATKDILDKYSDIDLIEDARIKLKAGTAAGKLGFNRYDKLLPFTKENLLKFRSDLLVNLHDYIPSKEKETLVADCTYIERQNDILIFRNSLRGQIIEQLLPYPKTCADFKKVQRVLKPNHFYVGYKLEPIFRHFQTGWIGDSLTVELIDVWQILSLMGKPYEALCALSSYDETMRLLWMISKPELPCSGLDDIDIHFFTLLWMLLK